jgi:hypothetical protein
MAADYPFQLDETSSRRGDGRWPVRQSLGLQSIQNSSTKRRKDKCMKDKEKNPVLETADQAVKLRAGASGR